MFSIGTPSKHFVSASTPVKWSDSMFFSRRPMERAATQRHANYARGFPFFSWIWSRFICYFRDILALSLVLVYAFLSSVIVYFVLYFILIPRTRIHVFPIHFEFSAAKNIPPAALLSVTQDDSLLFLKDGLSMSRGWISFSSCILRIPILHRLLKHEPVSSGLKYDVFVDLFLPSSPANRFLGMFMVHVDLLTQTQEILYSLRRAALFPYRNFITYLLRNLMFSIFYILKIFPDGDMINVAVGSSLSLHQIYAASVSLSDPNVEVLSASLRFVAKFSGIRYYLYHYFYLCSFIGIGCLFFSQSMVLLSCFFLSRAYLKKKSAKATRGLGSNLSANSSFAYSEECDVQTNEEQQTMIKPEDHSDHFSSLISNNNSINIDNGRNSSGSSSSHIARPRVINRMFDDVE